LQQRRDALERANVVRTERARLKREMKAGRVLVADLLADPPEFIETMKVWDLLVAVPKLGRVKVNAMLRKEAVSPAKTVGGLSVRQRALLVERLR
jgi:hypothetical protein